MLVSFLHDRLPWGRINNCFVLPARTGADPGFKKGGFNVVPKSDTGGATHNYL